jgi:integrase
VAHRRARSAVFAARHEEQPTAAAHGRADRAGAATAGADRAADTSDFGWVHRLRDRLLFAVLLDTGMRIGEALGLRHEALGIAQRQVVVMPRVNDNRARVKAGRSRMIPAVPS